MKRYERRIIAMNREFDFAWKHIKALSEEYNERKRKLHTIMNSVSQEPVQSDTGEVLFSIDEMDPKKHAQAVELLQDILIIGSTLAQVDCQAISRFKEHLHANFILSRDLSMMMYNLGILDNEKATAILKAPFFQEAMFALLKSYPAEEEFFSAGYTLNVLKTVMSESDIQEIKERLNA